LHYVLFGWSVCYQKSQAFTQQGKSLRVIPQIGLLVLCLGVAGGAFQFLSVRWEFWLLWKKVVIQTAVFHL